MLNVNDKILVKNYYGQEMDGKVISLAKKYVTVEIAVYSTKDKTDEPVLITKDFSLITGLCKNYHRFSADNSMYLIQL